MANLMYDSLKNFYQQFTYVPTVEGGKKLKKYPTYIVVGMGGSNLTPGLLALAKPELQIYSHRNYGLPALPKKTLSQSLVIASSYSGNTEETIDAFQKAVKAKIPVVAVTTGGKLLDLAHKFKKPFVQMPRGIQPRTAMGYSLLAIAKVMGEQSILREASALATSLKSSEFERAGKTLARKLKGNVPVIYASQRNGALAYNWKIRMNETGKIPAFSSVFPELNHSEMTGFDVKETTRDLSQKFFFVFLKDPSDNPRILKRMNVTERLYRERGLSCDVVIVNGKSPLQKAFSSIHIADWTAYYLAKEYGVDPENVPLVEEFKKLIK
ncbi:MAG: bifunctional phosphoglucose/phosphomannose isomerase [Patescibacteria group bacterium]|nr:bifunctional phosphoglucose/phosphomannose isomerase [Patescibacteria group bacterium]